MSSRAQIAVRPPVMEPSPLEKAFEDYQHMEAELAEVREKNQQLMISNASLLSEVHMLREELERADIDRVRLQSVSSTLLGRLLSINDTIAGAVKDSIRHGIEATEAAQSAKSAESTEMAPSPIASPRAPQALPEVNWPGDNKKPNGT